MIARREIGRARGLRPQENLTPRAPDIFLDLGASVVAPAMVAAPSAASELATPASGGFDIAAIRPGREQSSFAERSVPGASRSWGGVVSAFLHLGALAALLTWATPTAEPTSPEPLAIDIVPEMPATVARESQPPLEPVPPVAETPPPLPTAEPSPPPVAETPPPPPIVEPSPAPVAETPPPPPVAEPSPPPVAETPPPPPIVEPSPAPVAETPPPPPVAESSPPPVAETAPPRPEPSPPPVDETPPPPVAERSPPPVAKAPPPKPAVESPLRPAPVASPAPPRVPKPPPPTPKPTLPRVAKPTSPEKERPRLSHELPESSLSAARSTGPTSTVPRAAASSAEAAAYQGEVLARIAAQKRYPEAARERAPHGVAVIRFSIGASGQLVGASLSQSAGDPMLDAEALATVRRASPFPPPPAGAPRNFSAPLSYRVQ